MAIANRLPTPTGVDPRERKPYDEMSSDLIKGANEVLKCSWEITEHTKEIKIRAKQILARRCKQDQKQKVIADAVRLAACTANVAKEWLTGLLARAGHGWVPDAGHRQEHAFCESQATALLILEPQAIITLVVLYGARVRDRPPGLMGSDPRFVAFLQFLEEHLPERFSGAMQQHSKIRSTHPDLPTDLVLVPFVEKNPLQQKMILL